MFENVRLFFPDRFTMCNIGNETCPVEMYFFETSLELSTETWKKVLFRIYCSTVFFAIIVRRNLPTTRARNFETFFWKSFEILGKNIFTFSSCNQSLKIFYFKIKKILTDFLARSNRDICLDYLILIFQSRARAKSFSLSINSGVFFLSMVL